MADMDHAPLESFAWGVSLAGYHWQQTDDDALLRPVNITAGTRKYMPLIDPSSEALFKTFCSLEPSAGAFIAFANSHGALGTKGTPFETADRLSDWFVEWWRLRQVVDVLEIARRSAIALRNWFSIGARRISYSRTLGEFSSAEPVARAGRLNDDLFRFVIEGRHEAEQLRRCGMWWAQAQINQALVGTRGAAEGVSAMVLRKAHSSPMRFEIHLVPQSLLAAMWLQATVLIVGDPKFRQCAYCDRWFDLSTDGRRRNQRFCSTKHRVYFNRNKAKRPQTRKIDE